MYMITTIGMVTNIRLVRGDSFYTTVALTDDEGAYTPAEGDSLAFDMGVLAKAIPTDTLQLVLDPADTAGLALGVYPYSIKLTKANGDVDTVVRGKFYLV